MVTANTHAMRARNAAIAQQRNAMHNALAVRFRSRISTSSFFPSLLLLFLCHSGSRKLLIAGAVIYLLYLCYYTVVIICNAL